MTLSNTFPSWRDKPLFTPGPLTTSRTVKQAMLRDLGSRDQAFIEIVKDIRSRLVSLAECSQNDYSAILMPGSGTFGIEAVISSVIPESGKLLILVNGAYGDRICKMADIHKIKYAVIRCDENISPEIALLEDHLANDLEISHVAVVHCETTTGIFNPIAAYGNVVRQHNLCYIVDAMSSFGAVPLQMELNGIDYLISSSNKNIEGVPGFSFVIARKEALMGTKGLAKTLSLNLFAQWEGFEKDGQFRFTPPTQVILAFHQALLELEAEGGIETRELRYRNNFKITMNGMLELGFKPYLDPENQGYIISSFMYPQHPNFNFPEFYKKISDMGYVIYPGKLSHADCFRIGHIGRITEGDIRALLHAISDTLLEMGIQLNPQ